MRKARVWRREPASLGWSASVADYNWVGKAVNVIAFANADTWSEAMFLAQLLADPHEYIRAAQESAWHGGKSVGRIQEYFKIPGPISPYRKEDQ